MALSQSHVAQNSGHELRVHNRFLRRNWWCGIIPLAERSQVTTHIRCVLGWPDGRRRVMATVTVAFIPIVDVVISYGRVKSCPSSHRLCPITQLEPAGYGKESCRSLGSTFSHNRLARAGYVVLTRFAANHWDAATLPKNPVTGSSEPSRTSCHYVRWWWLIPGQVQELSWPLISHLCSCGYCTRWKKLDSQKFRPNFFFLFFFSFFWHSFLRINFWEFRKYFSQNVKNSSPKTKKNPFMKGNQK